MMSRDRVAAVTLLVLGSGGALESRRLTLGSAGNPGPGFFPFWLALGLCAVAIALLLVRPAAPPPAVASGERLGSGKVVLALAASAVYAFILPLLGFVASTFLFLLVMLTAIELRRWASSVVIAAMTAAVCHVLFKTWLDVQLPSGPWGF